MSIGVKITKRIANLFWCLFFFVFWSIFPNSLSAEEEETSLSNGVLFTVNQIDFSGNTVFTDVELLRVITPLENEEVTLDRLIQVRREVTDYYTQQGYIATGAFIPPQELNNGKVKIVVVEGKIAEVAFEQDNTFHEQYIKDRLPSNDRVLNFNSLKSALSELQKSPFIKNIQGEITFSELGKIRLLLDVEENPRVTTEFNLSNTFAPSIGELGGQGQFKFNTLGIGDIVEVNTTKTEGLNQISLSYSLPLNKYDTQLSFKYINASSNLVLEELEELDVKGEFDSYSLEFTQPILLSINQQLDLKAGLNIERSESFILDDFSFSFVDGLDNGIIRTSELTFIQQYITKGLNKSFVLSSAFNVGVDIFDSTVTTLGRDGLYWNWQFQSQGIVKLNSTFNWISDIKLQLSPDNLLPSKQFSLGGIASVRGYNRNLILGNNGISISNELQTSIYKTSGSELKVIGFIDAGRIWGSSAGTDLNQNLFSSGLGLQYLVSNIINLRLDYAFPFNDIDDLNLGASTSKFTFSVQLFQ